MRTSKAGTKDLLLVNPFYIKDLPEKGLNTTRSIKLLKKYKILYKEYSEYLLNDINITVT